MKTLMWKTAATTSGLCGLFLLTGCDHVQENIAHPTCAFDMSSLPSHEMFRSQALAKLIAKGYRPRADGELRIKTHVEVKTEFTGRTSHPYEAWSINANRPSRRVTLVDEYDNYQPTCNFTMLVEHKAADYWVTVAAFKESQSLDPWKTEAGWRPGRKEFAKDESRCSERLVARLLEITDQIPACQISNAPSQFVASIAQPSQPKSLESLGLESRAEGIAHRYGDFDASDFDHRVKTP